MISFIKPCYEYVDEYQQAYLDSYQLFENSLINKRSVMFLNNDIQDVVVKLLSYQDKETLQPGFVVSHEYFVLNEDNKFCGRVSIRTELNDFLGRYGGHIGYAIAPKYFRKGYGTKVLNEALKIAKEIVKEEEILVTCDDDNVASIKVIEKNKLVLKDKIVNIIDDEKVITRRYCILKGEI